MDTKTSAQIGRPEAKPEEKVRYVLYARKSSESEERQILSVDSQIKEMLAIAEREELEVIDVRRESHSAKDSGKRPVFNEILEDIRRGRFNGILAWNADRLARNAGDLGSLVDLMDQKLLLEIKTYGQRFTDSPSEKFLLMILCSQAKLENDNKGVNVRRGLRAKCELGLWPAPPATGYLTDRHSNRKGCVMIDPKAAPIIKKMFEKVAYEHWSGRKLYHWLKFELNFKTTTGNKNLTLSNVYIILQNHFYYGVFEYPKKSGNWYQGKHEPIISKELFDATQVKLKPHVIKSESKEFAFTRIMVCGRCGSGITADEKFKKQKNGNIHRYVYYLCTGGKDRNCRNPYIREEDLIEQFEKLMEEIDINEAGMREKLKAEVARFKEFQHIANNATGKVIIQDIDLRNYAKYLLRNGTNIEKRELLSYLKNSIILDNKLIRTKRTN